MIRLEPGNVCTLGYTGLKIMPGTYPERHIGRAPGIKYLNGV